MPLSQKIQLEADILDLNPTSSKGILIAPLFLTFIFSVFLAVPFTREFTILQLSENHPVELITFIALICGSIMSLKLAIKSRKSEAPTPTSVIYGVLAFLLFVIGMEEIAWGQWFLGFETPESLKAINRQGEVTLHNIDGIHGKTEFIRLAFGLGGLLAYRLSNIRSLQYLIPVYHLAPWFGIVLLTTLPDIWNDYSTLFSRPTALFKHLSELNEMLISLAGVLYIKFNDIRLTKKTNPITYKTN